MNVSITLDYELFFGRGSGSAQRTLVEPTDALCAVARRHGVPLVFFVDATWLLRLREQARLHPVLMAEHYRVAKHLEQLAAAGHELQLHVHPHWLDSHWNGHEWVMDLRRYRLHDWSDAEIAGLIADCSNALRALAGPQRVCAYRAGGWCIQPFERLRVPLMAAGIGIDSTVYAGGVQAGPGPQHDFRAAPQASRWRFEHDPLQPDATGRFLELPIASHATHPLFYWRLAASQTFRLGSHRRSGDGAAMKLGYSDLARKLLRRTTSVVSIDGLKASFLEAAFADYQRRGLEDFVVIGHPKAFTPYSLRKLDEFLQAHADERVVGLNSYLSAELRAAA